jgi:serine/threonine-protein phosphatase 4 regulatory subunit 2
MCLKSKLFRTRLFRIKSHLLHSQAPFTIQRICDLAIRPRQHYTTVGTYLRALERTLLITSTWDQYTLDTYITNDNPATIASNNVLRQATTPLFSPIPFLANRSESGSPPLSPLALDMEKGKRLEKTPPRVGLVDELDDLAPGHNHMADHPKALSSVTSLPSSSGESVLGLSLNERFTRSKTPEPSPARVREAINNDADDGEVEDMVLDDIEPSSERKEESSAANQNKES